MLIFGSLQRSGACVRDLCPRGPVDVKMIAINPLETSMGVTGRDPAGVVGRACDPVRAG